MFQFGYSRQLHSQAKFCSPRRGQFAYKLLEISQSLWSNTASFINDSFLHTYFFTQENLHHSSQLPITHTHIHTHTHTHLSGQPMFHNSPLTNIRSPLPAVTYGTVVYCQTCHTADPAPALPPWWPCAGTAWLRLPQDSPSNLHPPPPGQPVQGHATVYGSRQRGASPRVTQWRPDVPWGVDAMAYLLSWGWTRPCQLVQQLEQNQSNRNTSVEQLRQILYSKSSFLFDSWQSDETLETIYKPG